MGASQTHGQRYTYQSIQTYRNAPQGVFRYNSDYGYLNGQILSGEQNFYNKPLAILNHNWKIDQTSSLSTSVSATYGTGAANYLTGTYSGLSPTSSVKVPRTGDAYSPIDFNAIVKSNLAIGDGSAGTYFNDSENDHIQYGFLSTYKKQLSESVNLLGGVDLRYYEGEHFKKVSDLLGGQYVFDNANVNYPNAHAATGDKFGNDYKFGVVSEGLFLQTEYAKDDLSAFISLAGNNTANRRIDYFNYLNSDPNQKSPWVKFWGYQAKGGANYNIDSHSNVFANIGYILRSPLVGTIFIDSKNDINPDAKPEKLLSYELGYGFKSAIFTANVNLYRSTYKDRAKTYTGVANQDGTIPTYNISGINEVHQGIEFDGKLRPIKDVTLSGMLSIGDYHYLSNTGAAQVTNDAVPPKVTNVPSLLLQGLKTGDFGTAGTSAQTTAALGLDVNVLPQVKIGTNFNFYSHYYASFDPSKITAANGFDTTPYVLYNMPDYSTVDLNVVYRFKLAGLDASFIGNVYNALNTAYLADGYELAPSASTQSNYFTRTNNLGVWYGTGRTFMTTLKIKF